MFSPLFIVRIYKYINKYTFEPGFPWGRGFLPTYISLYGAGLRGDSPLTGYLFQASGISKSRDFTSLNIWKVRGKSVISVGRRIQRMADIYFKAVKRSRKRKKRPVLVITKHI